ncbi:MAG: DnaB-like helicase C-terminal domain-containing protein [Synechococcaceae cyanobacterium]|nr:DnaB-like helicase C-terminal domain-containing protein [Synechococcaceae cyanobacterium]
MTTHPNRPALPARSSHKPRPPKAGRPLPAPETALPQAVSDPPPGGVFDGALLDELILSGDWVATSHGPFPLSDPEDRIEPAPPELLEHERNLLAAVLQGPEDRRELWGIFRRRLGLRFNEPVPEWLWSHRELRWVAAELDAIFLGQRDVRVLNAAALRQDLRERALAGRWQGCLQQAETTLVNLLGWAEGASALDFPIACDLLQTARARHQFSVALRRHSARIGKDVAIEAELHACRQAINEAIAITAGRLRDAQPVLSPSDAGRDCLEVTGMPLEERPKAISTGIPSLDLDMRGGVFPGQGEGTYVLAARSGVGKTTVAVAAAMGLVCNGAGVLFLSCELSRRAIGARLIAHYCRRALGLPTSLYSANDLEGRGRAIVGAEHEQLQRWIAAFSNRQAPDGRPMGKLFYQSRFAASVEEISALVEDSKAAHPELSVVVLDHFHAMGSSPGFGPNTTAELAARAMALKALAGRCEIDILVVAQLNRGAYGSSTPDVSHLAGTSELERYASAVWLLERPKIPEGVRPARGVLEVHHGKFRHGQLHDGDLSRSLIRIDRAHCFLEADEARVAFVGSDLYPGVEAQVSATEGGGYDLGTNSSAGSSAEDGQSRAPLHQPRRR